MEGSGGTDSKETEEYEDDFEKDLEWLINEKEKSDVSIIEMACGNEEDICPELQEHETEAEHTTRLSDPGKALTDEVSPRSDFISVPSSQPLDPASDSDSENSFQESKLDSQKDLEEDEDEEVKRYIMEKIAQANKLLQTQEPVDDKRERKLKFKDKLVDLEVPPLEDTDNYTYYFESESHVSGKLSQLRISSESGRDSVLLSVTAGSCEESKDRKILVERDGKFELLNLQDIESQGCLPPIHKVSSTENGPQQSSPRSSNSPVNGVKKEEPIAKIHGSSAEEPWASIPQPLPNPKTAPSSAANSDSNKGSGKPDHRTQSANISPVTSTYCLSPRQKELQKRLEQKREKLKREEEQRKIEEENEKKKENDAVFKAWLQKKREQVLEMRRVQRAKQLEDMSSRQENRDPQQAFRLWLKKKHEEQLRERKTEELRKQEEFLFFLKGAAGRDRAFKQWLRRKRIEKLVEQQAVKERARQLRLEAKRSRQLQNQLYNMSEAQSFRFTDYYS
ncbi:coiled-coil domain-containing protein 181 isoform X3 [Desmodus rotundus]|uniref:Coiled-coil domain-containing protein 181 n=3 Tax=Desmodus rotundus TaxID=9430 RepID=K9IKW0_DESRO|nr:coiled-coil domain-containing protein 181 isoform X3 [Desmodus rotundus]XP_053771612.1 coiled-coil domain-containing protein 181 isoform X3 [Desmodus rotundus]